MLPFGGWNGLKPRIREKIVPHRQIQFDRIILQYDTDIPSDLKTVLESIKTENFHPARCWPCKCCENPEQSCFPGAVASEQAKDLAGIYAEAQSIECPYRCVGFLFVHFHKVVDDNS